MGFPTTSSQIGGHNSLATSGNNSALASGYPHASPPPFTQKPMAKQNGQTRPWNNTCVLLFPTNKMIGRSGYLWQNSQPTTNTPKQLRQLPSWPTLATILNVLSTCPPPPVHQKILKHWKLRQNFMKFMKSSARRFSTHRPNNKKTLTDLDPPPYLSCWGQGLAERTKHYHLSPFS